MNISTSTKGKRQGKTEGPQQGAVPDFDLVEIRGLSGEVSHHEPTGTDWQDIAMADPAFFIKDL